MKHRTLVIAALLSTALLPLRAQVPQIINYQGRISSSGTPFSGTGQFKLALVDGAGTSTYWSNDGTGAAGSEPTTAVSLPVVNGLYVVPMGDATLPNMTGIPATVFSNADVRVRVWFNNGTSGFELLTPDQRITSVGYAMMAAQAQSVANGAITSAMIANGAVGTSQLATGITITGNVNGNATTATTAANATALASQLGAPGSINQAGNPVDWTQLKNVPAGFADGVDSTGVTSITAGAGLTGGTITGSGTIALSGDVPRLSNPSNSFSGSVGASAFLGNGGGLFGLNASQLTTGTVPGASLGGTYGNPLTFTNAGNSFTGNGGGLTNLSGSALQSGSVPLSALESGARPKCDRQMVLTSANMLNYGGSYIDVPGMTLTTKNLGENGTYIVSFSGIELFNSLNGSLSIYALNVGGVLDASTESYASQSSSGSSPTWKAAAFTVRLGSVPSGTVIKLQVRNSQGAAGQLLVEKGKLTIDGVPSSQVVP